jgi:polyisoprenoid-binding protein YceI
MAGTLRLDPADPAGASVAVTIDPDSIATGQPFRDNELRGERFFDVARHPAITFQSRSVTVRPGGRLEVAGTLSLHGVSRPVVVAVEGWSAGPDRAGFSRATLRLDKRDYGLTAMVGPAPVCDQVEIALSLEAERDPAAIP